MFQNKKHDSKAPLLIVKEETVNVMANNTLAIKRYNTGHAGLEPT